MSDETHRAEIDETSLTRDDVEMVLETEAVIRRVISEGGAGSYKIAVAVILHMKAAGWHGPHA
jgi:hypothetical protein